MPSRVETPQYFEGTCLCLRCSRAHDGRVFFVVSTMAALRPPLPTLRTPDTNLPSTVRSVAAECDQLLRFP